MTEYDMGIHTNPDAQAWADFFRETWPDCNVPDDVMVGWFANAMMAMHDHLRPGSLPGSCRSALLPMREGHGLGSLDESTETNRRTFAKGHGVHIFFFYWSEK